ncbi:MAG: hypothetical protein CBD03_04880 [Rhizobiales bacterium TMED143]|nr:hypothetical protein [Rhodobiaceae bacterium]OUV91663.1 MAG: hypothetical protein CBD03_04880 [Rhizobiales bacterium TMED143]CAI8430071.1 MAG: High-affinity zinc uptake system membrane protein ZnuB [Rhodobiaceae bacterium UBA7378]
MHMHLHLGDMNITSALIAGLALSLAVGPLGCFVVWRRMAYFGDGLSHSALLGVAMGLVFGISDQLGMVLIGILFALSLMWLRAQRLLATDTLLGLLAHATLAFGILAMTFLGADEIDVHDYLLGSLESISSTLAIWVIGGSAACVLVLMRLWPSLVLMTTSEELAHAEGVPVARYEFILMMMMGLIVAVSVQIVGILLITSLLIIPASTSRLFSNSPETMGFGAAIAAALCILTGVPLAGAAELPAGPTIVSLSVCLFILTLIVAISRRTFSRRKISQ